MGKKGLKSVGVKPKHVGLISPVKSQKLIGKRTMVRSRP